MLLRLQQTVRRYRAVEAAVALVAAAQPSLHLAGEVGHRALVGQDPGAGAAHVGLLGLHLGLVAALVALVVLTDVLVLAAADAIGHVVRLLAALSGALPDERPAVPPAAPGPPVGSLWPWLAYTLRRGPPRTVSFA